MAQTLLFGEVLEAVDKLSQEEQETLISILERRLMERRRRLLIAEIQISRQEFLQGKTRVTTVEELMDEILS